MGVLTYLVYKEKLEKTLVKSKKIKDQTLSDWLEEEFTNKHTRDNYGSALRKFKEALEITCLDEYIKSNPDVVSELKRFSISLNGRPSKTISTYMGAVKLFFQDHGFETPSNEWKKLRKRGFLPKRVKAETQDKIPSKSQLKRILNYMNIKGKSMVLFLVSSGARIGETVQLEVRDFDLDSDPPKATIRSEYTKGGVGQRTVYFSYEARDAIQDWLNIKNQTWKHGGLVEPGTSGKKEKEEIIPSRKFEDDRMFSWQVRTARFIWNYACNKAGLGMKDNRTNRRIYHLHSLRKFFRTNLGLDLGYIHALMGHAEYLDEAYLRKEQKEIANAYISAIKNVSVYSATLPRKEEVKRALAMQGLTFEDVLKVLGKEMYDLGVGSGGGYGLKVLLDEDYIASLEDQEIGSYALKALREKLLGEPSKNEPSQKVIAEDDLESFLADGWQYVNSLNNGSGKCIVTKS